MNIYLFILLVTKEITLYSGNLKSLLFKTFTNIDNTIMRFNTSLISLFSMLHILLSSTSNLSIAPILE